MYYLGFGQGPVSSRARIEGKNSAILFDPDANIDICIIFEAVFVGFLKEDFSVSALLLLFSLLAV
jgi:hypothetical protein